MSNLIIIDLSTKISKMNKKSQLLFGALSCFFLHGYAQNEENRPNIILIMADDLGWGDVGFNGNKIIKTPNLDALAKEGTVMDWFYSAAPVSSPTRASVLTGRHPFRSGVFHANVGILRPEEITLPEILKEKGYTSGHFGKWHLGTLTDKEKDANRGGSKHPELFNPPSEHGYDEAFVSESKVPTYNPMLCPVKPENRFWDYSAVLDSSRSFGTHYWNIKSEKVTDNLSGDDSRVIMDRVIPFIDQAVAKNTPFLSVVWFHAPHLPCVAGPEHRAMYQEYELDKRNYYGCITALDEQVGRLVRYLKDRGIYENTLLFFCSDNGPERDVPGTVGNFKERKRSLHEGGIRVPALAVWPGKIKGGKHLSTPCVTSDYLPTIASLLQIPLSHKIDGENIMPLLLEKKDKRQNSIVFCSDVQAAVVDGDYKLYCKKGQYELFHIAKDPYEKNNIISVETMISDKMKEKLQSTLKDFQNSFEGEEYGRSSYNRVKQDWHDVMNH